MFVPCNYWQTGFGFPTSNTTFRSMYYFVIIKENWIFHSSKHQLLGEFARYNVFLLILKSRRSTTCQVFLLQLRKLYPRINKLHGDNNDVKFAKYFITYSSMIDDVCLYRLLVLSKVTFRNMRHFRKDCVSLHFEALETQFLFDGLLKSSSSSSSKQQQQQS